MAPTRPNVKTTIFFKIVVSSVNLFVFKNKLIQKNPYSFYHHCYIALLYVYMYVCVCHKDSPLKLKQKNIF